MRAFTTKILIVFIYTLAQIFVEVVIIVVMEYLGAKVFGGYPISPRFIENVLTVLWGVTTINIILAPIYVVLYIICSLFIRKKENKLFYAMLNLYLQVPIKTIAFIVRSGAPIVFIFNYPIAVFVSCMILILCVKIFWVEKLPSTVL